jgi:hypothetical protein
VTGSPASNRSRAPSPASGWLRSFTWSCVFIVPSFVVVQLHGRH